MGYIYTKKEVLEMQKRPYEDQIAIMEAKICEAFDLSKGDIAVAFSGGKDSSLLLYKACQFWKAFYPERPLKVFFSDTTIEYAGMGKFVKQFVRWMEEWWEIKIDLEIQRPANNETFISVVRREGIPLVSKKTAKSIHKLRDLMRKYSVSYEEIVAWRSRGESLEAVQEIKTQFGGFNEPALFILGYTARTQRFGSPFKIPNCWLPLLNAPFEVSHKCCEILKHGNIPERFKDCTIMTGEMTEESEQRMASYRQTGCNQVWHGGGKSKPMGPVTLQTVLRCIKEENIPIFKNYGEVVEENGIYRTTGMYRTGCALCGFGMAYVPDRYKHYDESENARLRFAFKPLSEGGLGYREAFEYCNKYCGTNWYIPDVR